MAVDRQQARRDEAEKRRLEPLMLPALRAADRSLAREVAVALGITGALPNVQQITALAYDPILVEQYARVAPFFGDQVRPQLPADVEATPEEDAAIAAAILASGRRRAVQQAEVMGATNAEDAQFALGMAQEQAVEDGLSREEIATTAGALLLRKLTGRQVIRAATETQESAEGARQIEARELTGRRGAPPALPIGEPEPVDEEPVEDAVQPTKEWVTVGDDIVRPHHRRVDSQKRPIDVPFDVFNQRLMYPGDTSLGATMGNIVNCRCSSLTDVDEITASRRSRR